MRTVTCTSTGCPNNGIAFTVPDDGFPVTCGGCNSVIAAGTQN